MVYKLILFFEGRIRALQELFDTCHGPNQPKKFLSDWHYGSKGSI